MVTHADRALQAGDLPVVQYLNQRVTFDLLATLENGFSHFATIETQSSDSLATKSSLGAGIKNVLLGISFGGGISGLEEDSQSEVIREELVHTPASLFGRLRSDLYSKCLVRDVLNADSLLKIHNGDFVEFEATLHRIQITEILKAFEILAPFGEIFDEGSQKPSTKGGVKGRRNSNKQRNPMLEQVKAVQVAISGVGSQDIVAKLGGMSLLLTVENEYFIDPTMNGVLDGTFRVFGKVTRVIADDSESINLLRMSPLGKFPQAVESLVIAMNDMSEVEFEGGVSDLEIVGPTLQVIPIGIFA